MSSFAAIFSFLGGMMCVCSSMAEEDAASVSSTTYGPANKFKPLYKFRDDLKCWPSPITTDSGNCVSKSTFENNLSNTPAYVEVYTTPPDPLTGIIGKLITFWIYYSNQSSCADIPTQGKQGGHKDDWERITLHVQEDKLRHVSYAQHNGIYTRDARDVELTDDGHPIANIGKYSHGSYHNTKSKCSKFLGIDSCWSAGDYCRYYDDPRGGGVDWYPAIKPLSELPEDQDFPGSKNPHQRSTRPHEWTVCKKKAGNEVKWAGIKFASTTNTCTKNPGGLRDEQNTLESMAKLDCKYLETEAYGRSRVSESSNNFNDKYRWSPDTTIVGLSRVAVRAGARIDRIEFTVLTSENEKTVYKHGGDGGSYKYLDLDPLQGEYLTEVTVRLVKKNGNTRVGGLVFKTTKKNKVLTAGATSGGIGTYTVKARTNYHIVGTYGYSGGELDTIGFIETPIPKSNHPSLRGNHQDYYES